MKHGTYQKLLALIMAGAVAISSAAPVWAENFGTGEQPYMAESVETEAAETDTATDEAEAAIDFSEEADTDGSADQASDGADDIDFTSEADWSGESGELQFSDYDDEDEEDDEDEDYDDEDDDDEDDDDEDGGIKNVSIVSEPDKKEYEYGTVSGPDDIDLTGLKVKISYRDGTEETLSFTRMDEKKSDSRGTVYVYLESDIYDRDNPLSLGVYSVNVYFYHEYYGEEDDVGSTEISVTVPASTPSLKSKGNGVYSGTIAADTFAKFTPESDGLYSIRRTYTEDSHKVNEYYNYVYDSKLQRVNEDDCYRVKLKKGKVYYIEPFSEKSTVTVEQVWNVKSVSLQGTFNKAVYYTPVNFQSGKKNKYYIEKSPWIGKKLKITYSNGKTETVGVYENTKYNAGYVNAYIVYSGNKKKPQAGTYDVHFQFGESGPEAVLKKGIQVKNLSQMPAINGAGTKTMPVTSSTVYACLKTKSSGEYTIKVKGWDYCYLTIYKLKDGELKAVGYIDPFNGKSIALKENNVYYIGMPIYSSTIDLKNITFSVTRETGRTKVTAGKKKITVSFKKVTGASGYQIAYSTSKNSGYKYVNLNSKTLKKTITGLTSGKKYYVKVRAYKSIGGKKFYRNYSAIKTVKVK